MRLLNVGNCFRYQNTAFIFVFSQRAKLFYLKTLPADSRQGHQSTFGFLLYEWHSVQWSSEKEFISNIYVLICGLAKVEKAGKKIPAKFEKSGKLDRPPHERKDEVFDYVPLVLSV